MRLVVLLALFLIFPSLYASPVFQEICVKNICIQAEVADTQNKLAEGLMFRKFLDHDKGMLFILGEQGSHNFWMKNLNFPLDIIWINEKKEITEIMKNVSPCGKSPCEAFTAKTRPAFVLEVSAGFAEENNLKAGDKVRFKLP